MLSVFTEHWDIVFVLRVSTCCNLLHANMLVFLNKELGYCLVKFIVLHAHP
jgi:hypothetical protein